MSLLTTLLVKPFRLAMKAVLSTLMTMPPTVVAVRSLTSVPVTQDAMVDASPYQKFTPTLRVAAQVTPIVTTPQTRSVMPHATTLTLFHATSTRAEIIMEGDLDTTGEKRSGVGEIDFSIDAMWLKNLS